MGRKAIIILLYVSSVLAVSCGRGRAVDADIIPYVGYILSDTTSVEHSILDGYRQDHFGTIAVMGPAENTERLTAYLMKCDLFDNVDGKVMKDGLPDFAGETFAAYYDTVNVPYQDFFINGNEEALRELTVRHSVAALDSRCYEGAYSREASVEKSPSKIVIFSSPFSEVGIADADSLFSMSGVGPILISPVKSLVDKVIRKYDEGAMIGIWAESDVLSSGVFASAFRDCSSDGKRAADYVGFSPDMNNRMKDCLIHYLEMFLDSGNEMPLSAILIDDFSYPYDKNALSSAVDHIRNSTDDKIAKYRTLLSDDFEVIGCMDAIAESCYRVLRRKNLFTHRIAYPQAVEYMITGTPGQGGEIKYVELSQKYVHQ